MSLTLYEIDDKLKQALDAVTMDEETGELHGMEAVELLELELGSKLLAIGKYCKSLIAEAKAIEQEIDRLSTRGGAIERKYEHMMDLIQSHIKPDQEIKDSQCVLKLRACPPSVKVTDKDMLPDQYIRMKVSREPDKEHIKQALKDGLVIPGAELVTNYSLQIK